MGNYLIRLTDDRVTPPTEHYMEWSSIVDAPIRSSTSLDEMQLHQWRKHGDEGIEPSRFVRLASKGTSSHLHELKDIIGYNRAGLEETSLSVHQLIDVYVHDRPKMYGMIPNPETGDLMPHPKAEKGGQS